MRFTLSALAPLAFPPACSGNGGKGDGGRGPPLCWDSTANAPTANCDCAGDDYNCSAPGSKNSPYVCDSYGACQQTCNTKADCPTVDGKQEICDLGQCVAESCSSYTECAPNLCLGGKCQ